MRAAAVAFLLVAPLLAGCLGGGEDVERDPKALLSLDQIHIPDGAELIDGPLGAILQWTNVSFPFREEIILPEGATLVRVEGLLLEHDLGISTYIKNNETGRRRCNPDIADTAWNDPHIGYHQCSGLAAIDRPGTTWLVQVGGPMLRPDLGPTDDPLAEALPAPNRIRVVFEDTPLDGFAAQLDLSGLSMPDHALQPTEGSYVDSFDGTKLWVEVTQPEGEGPWPTIIASSPYNGQWGRLHHGGEPAMWEYWTQDWAQRGYATVNVDVRGFGLSGGCVEVWGENEQKDQAFIVDWVAHQAWNDGNIGFYGQSYVGTTPVAAAVQAPDALKAIIAVAPVINAYEDWHHGGVPNGENTGSPTYYQVNTDSPSNNPDHLTATGPVGVIENAAKGVCEPTLVAQANDPRAVYDGYYEERDFKLRADQVKAATLFTQGFEDRNVKSAMIPDWFNDIPAPKLGLFGHWVHQHPTRADEEVLFLGWMDQYVKGKDIGFGAIPASDVVTNVGTHRTSEAWPTPGMPVKELWPDWSEGTLSADEGDAAGGTLTITPADGLPVDPTGIHQLTVAHEVDEAFAITGTPHLHIRGTLETKGNAFLRAQLFDVHDGKRHLITYGGYNLAHDETHKTWTAVTGASDVKLPFLPTEYVFEEGHTLEIVLYADADPADTAIGLGSPVGRFTLGAHPDGVAPLLLDTVPLELYEPLPKTAEW